MAGGLDELFNLRQSALRVREARQELIASNIANADTPNYKARDIDFSAALKQVMQAKPSLQGALPLTTTSGAHLSGKNSTSVSGTIQYRNDQQGSIDGNNVDIDNERMQFADNAVRYEAAVTSVTGQIRSMLAVIQN